MAILQGTDGAGDAAWVTSPSDDLDFTGRLTTTDDVAAGTAKVIGGRAFASLADSTPIVQAAALGVYDVDYTIPANTLKAGSTLKIRAVVRVSTILNGVTTMTSQITLGGAIILISGASTATPAAGVRCLLEATLTFRAAPGGAVAASGVGTAIWGNVPAVVTMDPNAADAVPTFATNGALLVAVGSTPSGAGDTTGRHLLEQLYVEIL